VADPEETCKNICNNCFGQWDKSEAGMVADTEVAGSEALAALS
jgi:hypothetical protein